MNLTKLFPFAMMSLLSAATFAAPANSPRERISLDANWRFIKGDAPDVGTNLNCAAIARLDLATGNPFTTNAPAAWPEGNPGGNISYVQSGFDDSGWQRLNLPHDWGIEGPFEQSLPGATGRLPWAGIGWYRKHLEIPKSDEGKKIYLDVDGAMSYSLVWLNGKFVGGWPYGYSSWRVDLTPYVNFGGPNVIAIRLNNPPDSSRWYPGGGIYRNVWLVKTEPVHVAHWGNYITTPLVGPAEAVVRVRTKIVNETTNNTDVTAETKLYPLDVNGKPSDKAVGDYWVSVTVPAGTNATSQYDIRVANPKLWSVKHPNLYVAVTTLSHGGKLVDEVENNFGIRTIEFTATAGFLLNGHRVHLNGVCDHADLGALGMAINTSALARQIRILKSFGCNAIRTSHNPPAPELLDLCDRMGMLVMDESFDCWHRGKTRNDYHLIFDAWHERDWRAELRRDRDHPSVILWSIGNEVPDQRTPQGTRIAAELTAIAHQEDPTRPTTAACNDTASGFDGFQTNLDVFGYNYKPFEYGRFREANPNQPLFGSETASCISSRGEYKFPVSTNKADGDMRSVFQVSSYDLYAPRWATPPDWEFAGQDKYPFVAGEFVWTGFDYLGEPTPYGGRNDPARSSYFGIVDLAGFPKDRYYLYQSRWRPNFPMAHILPTWNWPDRVGKVTPVFVYTSGDSAELFLNGHSLGMRKKGPFQYRLEWNHVKYHPGTLKVVAYKNGKRWATDVMKTAGPAAKLILKPDHVVSAFAKASPLHGAELLARRPMPVAEVKANGKDLCYVTVKVVDRHGVLCPHADNHIKFEVSGPGEIVATDNGNPTSFESFQAPEHNAFNGLALVIVRAKAGQPGTFTVKAQSTGLRSASIRIVSK